MDSRGGTPLKASRLGVVSYKPPHAEIPFKCIINADQTLTRVDNMRVYDAVSSFVQDVESEVTQRRADEALSSAFASLSSSRSGNQRMSLDGLSSIDSVPDLGGDGIQRTRSPIVRLE